MDQLPSGQINWKPVKAPEHGKRTREAWWQRWERLTGVRVDVRSLYRESQFQQRLGRILDMEWRDDDP